MQTPQYLHDFLERNARSMPDKPALICDDRTLSWHELEAAANRASAGLTLRLNTSRPQHPIGLLMPNSWQMVVATLAIWKAGHIAVPLDPSLKQLEINTIAKQLELDLIITNDQYKGKLPETLEAITFEQLNVPAAGSEARPGQRSEARAERRATRGNSSTRDEPASRDFPPAEQQVATILFTSGTTGAPKAVPYTHANYLWNVRAVSDLWQWTSDDTQLMNMPLSHWHGLAMGLGGALYHGNTVYLPERFDAAATLELLESGNISLFMHVPNAYAKIVSHQPEATYDLSRVRLFVSGSSYLPPAVWRAFKTRFGHEILERYGSSETGIVASNKLDERKPGSVGYVLAGVSVRMRPDGELILKSPGLFPGYYRNAEATAAKRAEDEHWLTGDIGEFDHERLQLKGRIQEKMKKHSYTLYPRDLEWAMAQHAGVQEVMVLGIQSEGSLNDEIVYFIVGDITEHEAIAYAQLELPSAWRPDIVHILPEIPRTRSGKPAMAKLREIAEQARRGWA